MCCFPTHKILKDGLVYSLHIEAIDFLIDWFCLQWVGSMPLAPASGWIIGLLQGQGAQF